MMRTPLITGNWKLHKTLAEAEALTRSLVERTGPHLACEVVIAPPATALATVGKIIKDSEIKLAGQNTYWKEWGAFTGEISPLLLQDVGCDFCIVGHSERRQLFGETNSSIRKKLVSLLLNKLTPILCVGETLEQRESGKAFGIVLEQLEDATSGLDAVGLASLVIAYEPVWAIGTGRTAQPNDAQQIHAAIRSHLAKLKGRAWAEAIRIVYGGSVKPCNAEVLLAEPDIDGALVGSASLCAEDFNAIIDAGIRRAKGNLS